MLVLTCISTFRSIFDLAPFSYIGFVLISYTLASIYSACCLCPLEYEAAAASFAWQLSKKKYNVFPFSINHKPLQSTHWFAAVLRLVRPILELKCQSIWINHPKLEIFSIFSSLEPKSFHWSFTVSLVQVPDSDAVPVTRTVEEPA